MLQEPAGEEEVVAEDEVHVAARHVLLERGDTETNHMCQYGMEYSESQKLRERFNKKMISLHSNACVRSKTYPPTHPPPGGV